MSAVQPIPVPPGLEGVEHHDGKVHAVELAGLVPGQPIWRVPPVCGAATGVSSDEGGPAAIGRSHVTCWECISIIS